MDEIVEARTKLYLEVQIIMCLKSKNKYTCKELILLNTLSEGVLDR
jgi:hypothetical protein